MDEQGLKSIIYYRQWAELVSSMPKDTRLSMYDSLNAYLLGKVMPNESDPIYWLFRGWVQQIEKDKESYEKNIVQRNRENGQKSSGRPKKNPNNPTEPKKPTGLNKTQITQPNPNNPTEPKKPYNDNINVNVNVKDNDNRESNVQNERFAFPSLSDVLSYAESKGVARNVATKYFNYRNGEGWSILDRLNDWKPDLDNWAINERTNAKTQSKARNAGNAVYELMEEQQAQREAKEREEKDVLKGEAARQAYLHNKEQFTNIV